jgi:hypothetical protein
MVSGTDHESEVAGNSVIEFPRLSSAACLTRPWRARERDQK